MSDTGFCGRGCYSNPKENKQKWFQDVLDIYFWRPIFLVCDPFGGSASRVVAKLPVCSFLPKRSKPPEWSFKNRSIKIECWQNKRNIMRFSWTIKSARIEFWAPRWNQRSPGSITFLVIKMLKSPGWCPKYQVSSQKLCCESTEFQIAVMQSVQLELHWVQTYTWQRQVMLHPARKKHPEILTHGDVKYCTIGFI